MKCKEIQEQEKINLQMQNKKKLKEKGITLIALVVTIIVLLILAGVTLNMALSGDGLFSKARKATEEYAEQSAREKLEMAMIGLQGEKYTNSDYNENDYINEYLTKEGIVMIPETDIAIVDGYKFEIDRKVPSIKMKLGKGNENNEINIGIEKTISEDYVNANLQIKVTYEGEIKEISVNGEKVKEIPKAENNVYTIEKEVKENGNSVVYVQDSEGNYKIGTIEITELTEDMKISTAEGMKEFAKKVNEEGRTFEGRTVTITQDIDLGEIYGENKENWKSIGYDVEKTVFRGTFNGNNYKIKNLYINNENINYPSGLFGHVEYGTVMNVDVDGEIRCDNNGAAGVVVTANVSKIENCVNHVNIIQINNERAQVGGICSWAGSCEIVDCKNYGNITTFGGYVGGIAKQIAATKIKRCANFGEVKVSSTSWPCGGILAFGGISASDAENLGDDEGWTELSECANFGTVSGGNFSGGIIGALYSTLRVKIENCFNSGNIRNDSLSGGLVGVCDIDDFKMNNCYNVGEIAGSKTKDPICCNRMGAKFSTTGVYFLDSSLESVCNATKLSESDMKTKLIEELDSALWCQDVLENGKWKYNNGFPILRWQTKS